MKMLVVAQLLIVLELLLGAPLSALIDRGNPMPAWYDPGVDQESAAALENMRIQALEEGIRFTIHSAYRSYDDQEIVYARELTRASAKLCEATRALWAVGEELQGTAIRVDDAGNVVEQASEGYDGQLH